MIIALADRFGPFLVAAEDGETVGAEIRDRLEAGDAVVLDLRDVRRTISAFWNPLIGILYASFPIEDVDGRVRFVNESPIARRTIEDVRDHARRYHSDPVYRDAHDAVTAELSV